MPIEQLSDQRRLTRDFKVRLGVRKTNAGGTEYPTETDYFVLKEAPDEVKELYRSEPKSLRIMLGFEWNQQSPSGDDLVFSLYNRAYGASRGLKCRGTGRSAEFFGTARTSDEKWAARIEQATGFAPDKFESMSGDPMWTVRCFGRDCPKFLHKVRAPDPQNPARQIDVLAPHHDADASCNDTAILRCFLLHPSTDPDSDDYCKVLGVMELATGSINSIIDLQSGFDLLKPYTGGRTAGIPMTLIRKPTTTFRPVRQVHYTCAIHIDHAEAQRWSAVPLQEVFLSETQRALLKQLQSQPLGLTVDSVRDLLPGRLIGAVDGGATGQAVDPLPATGADIPADPPETGSDRPVAPPTDPMDSPLLVAAQLDELKGLAGGPEDPEKPYDRFNNPWKKATLDRLRAAIVAMREDLGIEEPMTLSELRIVHYDWLKARLKVLPND